MADKIIQRCSAKVLYDSWGYRHQCLHNAKVERDGKWFCPIHDPVRLAEKRAAQEAKRDEKHKTQEALFARLDALQRATKGLTTEELTKLTPEMLRELAKETEHAIPDYQDAQTQEANQNNAQLAREAGDNR